MGEIEEAQLQASVKSASVRGKWVMGLLIACVIVDVAGILTGWLQLDFLTRVADGVEVSESEAGMNDALYAGVGILQMLLLLATAVTWFVWLDASYKNLRLVGSGTTKFTSGWVIGYWFIPVVNLFRPYQIIKELWLRSKDRNEHATIDTHTSPLLVAGWWLVWIVSGVVGRIFFRESLAAEDLASFVASTKSGILSDGVGVLAGLLALLVVRDINVFQRQWRSRITIGEPGS